MRTLRKKIDIDRDVTDRRRVEVITCLTIITKATIGAFMTDWTN